MAERSLVVALGWRGTRRSADVLAVRVVAVARLLVLLTLATVGSFTGPQHGRPATLLVLVGLAGIPWATAVLFASDRADRRLAIYGGPLGDLLLLFAVHLLTTDATLTVLSGYLAVVAFAVYTGGRRFAGVVVATAIVLTMLAHAWRPAAAPLPTTTTLPLAAGLFAVLFLVDRTTVLQERAVASSARFRTRADTIVAHVAEAVFVTDARGRLVLANPGTERLAARGAAALAGRPCHEALGLHVGERQLDCSQGCPLARTDADRGDGIEVWRYDASGQRIPLLADATLIDGVDGGVEVVHALRDITRLKQAEEAKTLFLATASHELKTPLTVISGFASTLLRYPDLDEPMRQSALAAIQTRAGELTRIVERLLLSSRIEAGRVAIDVAPVDMAALLRERVEACSVAMERTVTFHAPDEIPSALANADALTTVIDHLLDNAIKYSPGGGDITVEVGVDDDAIFVTVADSGIGMDDEQAAHCFDKFWQAEATDVRRFGGTGIGLYIVQSLVHAMRGSISVKSTVGEGTAFTLTFQRGDMIPQPRQPQRGESTSIREFMRQIGVPEVTRQ